MGTAAAKDAKASKVAYRIEVFTYRRHPDGRLTGNHRPLMTGASTSKRGAVRLGRGLLRDAWEYRPKGHNLARLDVHRVEPGHHGPGAPLHYQARIDADSVERRGWARAIVAEEL